MSKIKKTALIGVVGASALTAGYYTFVKPSIQTTTSIKKRRTLTKQKIKNQKIQQIVQLLQQKKV